MMHGDLQGVLDAFGLGVSAAEAHGRLCGALCVRGDYGPGDWARDLGAGSGREAVVTPDPVLRAVHEETVVALRSAEFGFAPLLPGEESPLGERVAALASWCDGFLFGFGTGASGCDLAGTGEVAEFLDDLSNIAHVELEAEDGGDAAEADFTELHEFVRAGTQLAWIELADARSRAAG